MMPPIPLTNRPLAHKWAVVTGSSRGIGEAAALRLAQDGANLVVHYHRGRQLAEALAHRIEGMGVEVEVVSADFRDHSAILAALTAVGARHPIDILVNNAGSLIERVAFESMSDEQWHDSLELNLSSVFYATRALSPFLKNGSAIVNVSSIAADNGGGPGAFAYAAAKSGLEGLTRGLAKALAPRQIRVNAVSPGTIATHFHEVFSTPERLEAVRQSILLGRLGTAEEVAELIRFLVSDKASYITGEVYSINGGQALG